MAHSLLGRSARAGLVAAMALGTIGLAGCKSEQATYRPTPNYSSAPAPVYRSPSASSQSTGTAAPAAPRPATPPPPPPPPAGGQMACGKGKCG